MGDVESSGEEKSQFHMSQATLERINAILNDCADASNRRELHKWYNHLLTLSKDYLYMLKEKNKEELRKIEINKGYRERINPLDKEYMFFNSRRKLFKFKKFEYFFALLESYELYLRRGFKDKHMMLAGKSEQKLF